MAGTSSTSSFGSPPQASNNVGLIGFILSIVGLLTCGTLNIISLPVSLLGLLWKPRGFAVAGTVISAAGVGFLALIGWGIVTTIIWGKGVADVAGKTFQTAAAISDAKTAIENYRLMNNTLPDGIEGNKLVISEKDGWGKELRYEVEGNTYVIRSAGPDQQFDTQDDITSEQQQVDTNLNIEMGGDGMIDGPIEIPSDSSTTPTDGSIESENSTDSDSDK